MAKKDKKAASKPTKDKKDLGSPQPQVAASPSEMDAAAINTAIKTAQSELKKFRATLAKAVKLVAKADEAIMNANSALDEDNLNIGDLERALNAVQDLVPKAKNKKSSSKAK